MRLIRIFLKNHKTIINHRESLTNIQPSQVTTRDDETSILKIHYTVVKRKNYNFVGDSSSATRAPENGRGTTHSMRFIFRTRFLNSGVCVMNIKDKNIVM